MMKKETPMRKALSYQNIFKDRGTIMMNKYIRMLTAFSLATGSISTQLNAVTIVGGGTVIINDVVMSNDGYGNTYTGPFFDCSPKEATGTMIERPFNQSVETIDVHGSLTEVIINDNEKPRIECDEAISGDIEFAVNNGRLSSSFKDGKPHCYKTRDGKPLCKIFAKLMGETLGAYNHSNVSVDNQRVNRVDVGSHAYVQGSIDSKKLDMTVITHGTIALKGNASEYIGINAANHGHISYAGSNSEGATNGDLRIYASNHGHVDVNDNSFRKNASIESTNHADIIMHNLSVGNINAYVSNHVNVRLSGMAEHEQLSVSGHATYDGSNLRVNSASVALANFAKAWINVKERLSGYAHNHSKLSQHGQASTRDVSCDRFSSCKNIGNPF